MTFLFSMLFFALAVALMSLGVILNGRRIQGSCGGLNTIPGIDSDCGGTCHSDPDRPAPQCPRRKKSCVQRSGAGPVPAGAGASPKEPSWPDPLP